MHPCLRIPEIIRIVVEKAAEEFDSSEDADNILAPPPMRPYGSVALSRLARTCRQFQDPALDVLWREQSSILPLLKCFPAHLWEHDTGKSGWRALTTFNFRTGISPMDWDRVLFYSHRIEEMSPGYHLTSEVLESLNVSLPTACFFPNLKDLSWDANDECFPFIRLFLGPKITAISLFCPSTPARLSLLPYMALKFPSLTQVVISGGTSTTHQSEKREVCSAFVLALKKVHVLSLPYIGQEAYRHLACLPTLESLTIGSLRELAFPGNVDQASFTGLRSLSISTPILEFGTNFLKQLSEAPLKCLELSSDCLHRAVELERFLTTLRDNCARRSLVSLDICIDAESVVGNAAPYEITLTVLRPLLAFTHLQRVALVSPPGFSMDDNDMAELSRAWPQLEFLDLSMATASSRTSSTVTISALAHFARHCPRLSNLTLGMNSTGLVESDAYPAPHEPRTRQTALKILCVLFSPIDSPALVARFLSGMFPSLRGVSTRHANFFNDKEDLDDPEVVPMLDKWQEVENLMPLLSAVRTDEERYWTSQSGRATTRT
ncbi:hypothetical protein FB451DRAFT_1560408 [Mycena latifolia]|nr:hypothetical protein FB451DRAFT_1560408 [Mycena latifolia]